MSGQLQLRRGSTAENDAFTGVEGELTYDTVKKELRIHDGVTQGGNKVPTLVAVQRPTAENNYTWYRKYADGWVEQGGQIPSTTASSTSKTVNLPITMTDTNYFACSNTGYAGNDAPNYGNVVKSKTTTTITVGHLVNYTTNWMVSGISAEQ